MLDPTEDLGLGTYSYAVVVEMEDYPSSQWPLVVRQEKPFFVKINPCLVTDLGPSVIPSKVEYIVGNRQKSVIHSFFQAPCSYDGTYSIKSKNGSGAPDFIEQLVRYPIFNEHTVDEDHVGTYTLEVAIVLDSVALFAALDPDMDDYIADINDPQGTYAGAGTLVYASSFQFDLGVFPPESEYEEADNTPPYLLPPPRDFSVEVGDSVEYFVGDIYDAEAANQTLSISADLGRAAKFARWDDVDHLLIIYEGEADEFDVGFYDVLIKVWDDFDVAVIEGYVECKDREYPNEEARIRAACQDRVAGVSAYPVKIEVRQKFEAGDVYVPPKATEVLFAYDGQVYDMGNATLDEVYATATTDGTIEVSAALHIAKLEAIDLASQQDQEGVDLEAVKAEREAAREAAATAADTGDPADGPPIPTVEAITSDGKMKIKFSAPLRVPEEYASYKDKEVAFRRSTEARTETYLADDGYQDFEIRPSIEMKIAPAPDSEPESLHFDWEIIEFTESYVVIQLLFENPDALSALDGKSMDQIQVTFWGDNLFVGKSGKSVPNGVTIRREVVRQVDPEESVWIKFYARLAGYGVLALFVLVYAAAKRLKADTYPIWSVVNTLVLVTHFPLLYLQLPGNISLWMKEFLGVLRLEDIGIERLLVWWGVTDEFDPALLADRGHNIYFE